MSETTPGGAVFHRCALQVNPHHYSSTFRGQEVDDDDESYAKAIVTKAAELDVAAIAVTDHNSVSGVQAFREFAESYDITIFPGFELSSAEGIHVLCIYPTETDESQLGRFLGEFGIHDTKPSANLSSQSFEKIIEMVCRQNGISIAAHATTDNGLLRVLSGKARIKAWRDPHLFAIQIPGLVQDLPQEYRGIVENKNLDYRRSYPADDRLALAVINAKDITKPEDLDDRSATCWIKMSEVSIEGLRQAFLDPGSRIRLAPPTGELEPEEHAELLTLAWEGGFLDGVTVGLNPNLNVLIGGRGAGKSTVIESLRYALDLDAIGEEASKTHQGIVRNVLRSGTKVSLRVRLYRPAPREYLIERTIPNPPVVRDGNGNVSNLRPDELLPRVEVYGQHEISELTRSGEKLTRLLDRFAKRDPALKRQKVDIRRDLEKTRRALIDVRSELNQIEERLSALPGLEETLERFREAGLEERLHERSMLVREERVLDTIPERLEPLRGCLESVRQEVPVDRVFVSSKALRDLPGKDILARGDGVLERLSRDLEEVVRAFDDALTRADEGVADIRSRWNKRKSRVQRSYERILRELHESAVDGEEFIRLKSEIEGLRPLRDRQSMLQRLETEHSSKRLELLVDWEDLKAKEFRFLARAAKRVGRELSDRVRVEVTAAGDRGPLFRLLRDEIGGRLREATDALAKVKDFSLPQLAASCRKGSDAVQQTFSVPAAQANRLAEAPDDALMRIEELELPATTTIQLNTAPAGEPPSWHALDDLSTGQKATAVLLLLLLESDAPLIVDQPEDDLDNRFITEGVVPRMRDEKRHRQFVFSTHNANIPVLGDAELILGLTAAGEAGDGHARIASEHIGSIDAQSVRELVEELLEGGKDAFEKRRLKYGF
ncbi:MAG: AAA family ATPase [Chloroflexota bacterium]|nr:AAA family ATPase [Chloroflexota bacterium]